MRTSQETPFDWCGGLPPEQATHEITLGRAADHVCTVDYDLLHLIKGYRWSLHSCGKGKLYARAQRCPQTGVNIRLYMHRLVCAAAHGPPPSPKHVADHRNGNGLDNRASNLVWRDAWANRWRHGAE